MTVLSSSRKGDTAAADQPSTLLPDTDRRVRALAEAEGNLSPLAEETGRCARRAEQQGVRSRAHSTKEAAIRRSNEAKEHLRRSAVRLRQTEAKVIIPGHRAPMGLAGWLVVLILVVGLLLILWNENGAAAQVLLSTGAFGVDTLWKGRVIMLTPIAVGIAFILGFQRLAPFIRNLAFTWACAALVVVFLGWAVSFALQAQQYTEDAQGIIELSEVDWAEASSSGNGVLHAGEGWSAWLMFGCLVVMMPLTSFIGHSGVEHYLNRYERWEQNPDYVRALEDVQLAEGSIARIDEEIAAATGKIAACDDAVQQEGHLARALYMALRSGATSVVIGISILVTGCTPSTETGGHKQLDRWVNGSAGRDRPVTRVIALSPQLPREEKATAREQLEAEIAWLADHAPVGSVTVIVDALDCVPVARLSAVPGVPRIRKKCLAKAVRPLRTFLNRPAARINDGRIHLPRLAQTAKQWDLPPGSHVVVLGNPLFVKDGKDNYFSMSAGRVPSDGCLFEDPKLNLYSILGREKALAGQFWHLGWSDDSVFADDSHRQAVLRFWFLYFQGQAATLVTAQASLFAAADAAREEATEPLLRADADPDAPPAMVRIVKVAHEHESQVEIKRRTTSRAADDVRKSRDVPENDSSSQSSPAQRGARSGDRRAQRDVDATETAKSHQRGTAKAMARHVADQDTLDQYGNLRGSQHDLVRDGEMRGQKIVLATFFSDGEVDRSPLGDALEAKGFTVERLRCPLPTIRAFESLLDEANQLWIWSSDKPENLPDAHLKAIVRRWKDGRLGLFLLADNTPFTAEASKVLTAVSPNSKIRGKYFGAKSIGAWADGPSGFDRRSPLFHNIQTLNEGTTISAVSGPTLTPACFASDGSLLIATLQNGASSRLVVHGGFTSFYAQFWDDAGVSRFAVNCAGWLAGHDGTDRFAAE